MVGKSGMLGEKRNAGVATSLFIKILANTGSAKILSIFTAGFLTARRWPGLWAVS